MEMLTYILKSAAILALFYLVYIMLLRRETHFKAHRVYLMAGLLGAILLPFLYFSKTIYIDAPLVSATTVFSESTDSNFAMMPEPLMEVDWWFIGLLIYIIGVLFVFIRFLLQLKTLLILLKSNSGNRINGFHYIQVSESIAPFSFFNCIVYNPQLHSEAELKMILKHEQAHAFQWHSADIILANVLVMLQWANPLAWLYKKSVEENLEFLADNATISRVPSKKEYQMALVRASSTYTIPALTTNFYKSFIKKRIIMLNKRTSKRHHVLKVAAVLPLLALFLLGFNVRETIAYNEPAAEELVAYENEVGVKTTVPSESVPKKVSQITGNAGTLNATAIAESGNVAAKTAVPVLNEEKNQLSERRSSPVNLSGEFRYKITKHTTDAELEKIKEQLKREHSIEFSYSTMRNSSNEITSISIQYSGKRGNGNYSIQDDPAIQDFVFYIDDEGKSGFLSERTEEREAARLAYRAARLKETEVNRDEMRAKREKIRAELSEKRKEMRDKIREKRDVLILDDDGESNIFIEDGDDDSIFIYDEDDDEGLLKRYKIARSNQNGKDSNNNIRVIRDSDRALAKHRRNRGHTIVIDKNMSDSALAELKNDLSDEGIKLNYSKVRRNDRGELTRIKIVVESASSKQTTVAEGDDGEAIGDLRIVID